MNHKHFNYEGKWALVTGASSGIGKTFAYELAARRANVILSSRSEAVLDEMARDIRERFKVESEVIPLDLAGLDAPERLFRKINEMNRTVQVLINNAGFGSYGRLQENPVERHASQILLNAFSPSILAQLFLPAMVAVGDGAIINVASIAAFQPTPYMAIYGASKAFVLSFSEALWAENLHTGVRVLALCPGPVDTGFFEAFGGDEPAAMGRRDTTENTVRTALRALDRGRSHVISGSSFYFWLSQSGRFVSRSTLARTSERILRPSAIGNHSSAVNGRRATI
jgi:short-subunit dehydrogenase